MNRHFHLLPFDKHSVFLDYWLELTVPSSSHTLTITVTKKTGPLDTLAVYVCIELVCC